MNVTESRELIEQAYSRTIDYKIVSHDSEIISDFDVPIGIFMHGFGASEEDIIPVCQEMLDIVPYWIVPQAPIKLLELLGYHAYAWFPSAKKDLLKVLVNNYWEKIESLDGLDIQIVSQKIIGELILPIRQNSINRPIVIAGFSQGGMIASEIVLQALKINLVIDKVLLFSSCIVAKDRWKEYAQKYIVENNSRVKTPPMWQSHGKHDLVLLLEQGKDLYEFWKEYTSTEMEIFEGQHEIPLEIIHKVRSFL